MSSPWHRSLVPFVVVVVIPLLVTAPYTALGRFSVFFGADFSKTLFPLFYDMFTNRDGAGWTAAMGLGTLTEPQGMRFALLLYLGRLIPPLLAYRIVILATAVLLSAGTFVLMRRGLAQGLFVSLAAAWWVANAFPYALMAQCGFALVPSVLAVFLVVLKPARPRWNVAVVTLVAVAIVMFSDFIRSTVWILLYLAPFMALHRRSDGLSLFRWWLVVVAIVMLCAVPHLYTLATFAPWSDRANWDRATSTGIAAMGALVGEPFRIILRYYGYVFVVFVATMAIAAARRDRALGRRIAVRVFGPLAAILVIHMALAFAVWSAQEAVPALASFSLRTFDFLRVYAPLTTMMMLGSTPADLAFRVGRWRVAVGTAAAVVVVIYGSGVQASRLKGAARAWLANQTVLYYFGSETLQELHRRQSEGPPYRVGVVTALGDGTNLYAGHVVAYGFETTDSYHVNTLRSVKQLWRLVTEPGRSLSREEVDLSLAAAPTSGPLDVDTTFRMPLLSLLNTRYLVSQRPLQGSSLELVHAPSDVGPRGSLRAQIDRNLHGGDFFIYRNRNAFERAFLVFALRRFADEAALLRALATARDEELRASAFALAADVEPLRRPGGAGSLTFTRRSAGFDATVESSGDAVLVVSYSFGPWWKCRVNDTDVRAFAADRALVAVALGAGRSHVRCHVDTRPFDFWPRVYAVSRGG